MTASAGRGATRRPAGPWTISPTPGSARSRSAWWSPATTSASSTRSMALADHYGAQLRVTRLRPSGRGADSWEDLHPTAAQQRFLYQWLRDRPSVLTGDSFFHLSALGEPLDGLNLCGAGRVVCLIDPVGDVYACPFVIHDEFLAGNVRDAGGFTGVWRSSERFASLREPTSAGACSSCGSYDACRGGCMAAKFFTGMPLDGPDPECVFGHGTDALAGLAAGRAAQAGRRPFGSRGPGPARFSWLSLRSRSRSRPGPSSRRRVGTAFSWCRSARSNSTVPTCRSTPTLGSRPRSSTRWPSSRS